MTAHSFMVANGLSASVSPVSGDDPSAEMCRKSAAIIRLPRAALPPVDDYARACAALIWHTFPANSQRGVCDRAERETGLASSDTFDRILSKKTQRIDSYLMRAVMAIASSRGVAIPPELAVRS